MRASKDETEIIEAVISQYNTILYDRVIPLILKSLFDIKAEMETFEKPVELLRYLEGRDFYKFNALPELVVQHEDKRSDIDLGFLLMNSETVLVMSKCIYAI